MLLLYNIHPIHYSASKKIPATVESLSRLLASSRDEGLFLDVLKTNAESVLGGKADPTGQLGLWEMALAAVQAFKGRREELDKADSILAMEKALLQVW